MNNELKISKKRNITSSRTKISSNINGFVWGSIIVIAVISVVGIIFAGLAFDNSIHLFSVLNPIESFDFSNEEFKKTSLIPCSNKTTGNGTREFTGETIIASTCQQPKNKCLVNICTENRTCVEQFIENATCSQNADCNDDNLRCDLDTCSCVEIPECKEDSDCPIIGNNACQNFTCISGNCTLKTLPGNECSNNQECLVGQYCSPICSCIFVNSTDGTCTTSSDCNVISNNPCENYTCEMGKCTLNTIPGNECANNQDCGVGQICGEGCTCVSSNECAQNSDCSEISNNPCESYTCIMNKCVLDTISGNECSNNQECGDNQYCGAGCTCTLANQCIQNSDCPILSNTTCENFTCINNICELGTIDGMECSNNQQCGAGEFCGDGCACMISKQCNQNSDCSEISNNPCESYTCVMNKCVRDTISGNGCATNQDCQFDQYCADNCTCATIFPPGYCDNNFKCPIITDNDCEEFVCTSNNRCNRTLAAGAECSTTQNCGGGDYCAPGCVCKSLNITMPNDCFSSNDCPDITNNTCAEFACINNTCTLQTVSGMECSTDQDCVTGEFCGNGCTCMLSKQCNVNSDCSEINNNACESFTCITNKCVRDTISGNQCATNQDCALNQYCAEDCTCKLNNGCFGASDCLTINNNVCASSVCISDRCELDTIAGMNCSTNQECGDGEFCANGCQCKSISSVQCVTDSECFSLSNNPCAEVVCNSSNVCVEQTKIGNDCSVDQECSTDEICGSNCNCTGPYIKENTTITATSINFGQTSLDYYETIDFTGGTTGAASGPFTGKLTRIGNYVIYLIPEITRATCGPGTINSDSSSNIPVRFRPIDVLDFTVRTLDQANSQIGFVELATDGSFRIFKDGIGNGFTSGTNCGNIHDIYITYMTNN